MASVHKRKRSPYWYGAYRTADGKVKFKSTGIKLTERKSVALNVCTGWEADEIERVKRALPEKREQAKEVLAQLERAATAGRKGRLDETLALELQESIGKLYGRGEITKVTVREWFKRWLDNKPKEGEKYGITEPTRTLYRRATDAFLTHLESKADEWIGYVTTDHTGDFRRAQITRSQTTDKVMRILRDAFQCAVDCNKLRTNPVARPKTDNSKSKKKDKTTSKRRAFTTDEIERILGACDGEWRGLVLMGLYTGQRLNDIRLLKWSAVDLVKRRVKFITQKSGEEIDQMLHPILYGYLEKWLPSSDNAEAFVFPRAAAIKHVGTVSNYFADILTKAGLRDAREHPKFKVEGSPGKNGKHKTGSPCYHMLRHTFSTYGAKTGASDQTVADAAGHSVKISQSVYVHSDVDDMVARLPDFTRRAVGG
jgi:integrase